MNTDASRKALEFLRAAHLFHLGHLPTEQPHPGTRDLSVWARDDLPRAIATLRRVDLQALEALERRAPEIDGLACSIREAHSGRGRVFLCGCGATGRLSLALESLWRARRPETNGIVSFMAGGDVALVHALEGFEDHADLGARHLRELGFGPDDLLIACTEGGETPFVLGATEEAASLSSRRPWLLFCNPEAALTARVERFRRISENPRVRRICLEAGPMALAGSTRMQASTVLQLAVGAALLHPRIPARELLSAYRRRVHEMDLSFLARFIEKESATYAAGDRVTYRVLDYGITVFTDTTERAPTFSLAPFDHLQERRDPHSLCYTVLDDALSPVQAWRRLLGREPRALDWPDVDPRATPPYLRGFDFGAAAAGQRRRLIHEAAHREFAVAGSPGSIRFQFGRLAHDLPVDGMPPLLRHVLLKQVLNIHSTLVMGRLGRYEGNLMTWVRPANGKLVDRAARYVKHLLERAGGPDAAYEDIVRQIFVEMDRLAADEPIVLRACESFLRLPRA